MAELRGGVKLQRALAELTAKLDTPGSVKIGFLAGARYPNGTSVAMVAAIQEYGAPRAGIPSRPFFRNTIAAKQGEWPAAIAGLLKSTDYDTRRTLELIGEAIKGQIQQGIRDFVGVPLKPATIKHKGHAKQLVETGHMLNSVAYEVNI